MRRNPQLFGGQIKAWCAIDAIAIEQCHCRQLILGANLGVFLGNRSPFEKAESGTRVKFDVQSGNRLSVITRISEPFAGVSVAINSVERQRGLLFGGIVPGHCNRDVPFFPVPWTSW